MERSKAAGDGSAIWLNCYRLLVERSYVESKEELIFRIERGKVIGHLRRKGDEWSECRKCGLSGAPAD